jgi:hypothetical protein
MKRSHHGAAIRLIRDVLLIGLTASLFAGCSTSRSSKDGPNAPLPRLSEDQAVALNASYHDKITKATGLHFLPDTVAMHNKLTCSGQHGQDPPDDGRFAYSGGGRAVLGNASPVTYLTQIRDLFRSLHFDISNANLVAADGGGVVAYDPATGWDIQAILELHLPTAPPSLSIDTASPCVLPPGATQLKAS